MGIRIRVLSVITLRPSQWPSAMVCDDPSPHSLDPRLGLCTINIFNLKILLHLKSCLTKTLEAFQWLIERQRYELDKSKVCSVQLSAITNLLQAEAPKSQGFERGRPGARRTGQSLFIDNQQIEKQPPDPSHWQHGHLLRQQEELPRTLCSPPEHRQPHCHWHFTHFKCKDKYQQCQMWCWTLQSCMHTMG